MSMDFEKDTAATNKIRFIVKIKSQLMKSGRKSYNHAAAHLIKQAAKNKDTDILNSEKSNKNNSPKSKTSRQHSPTFRLSQRLNPTSKSKSKQKSKPQQNKIQTSSVNRALFRKIQQKASKKRVQELLKNMYEKHELMKKNLERLKLEKEAREQQILRNCTFTPEITKSPRFRTSTTFLQRQQIRRQLRESQLLRKKTQLDQQFRKQCSFHPDLIARQKSLDILQKREIKQEQQKHLQTINSNNLQLKMETQVPSKSQSKSSKQQHQVDWKAVRSAVKQQLQRIDL